MKTLRYPFLILMFCLYMPVAVAQAGDDPSRKNENKTFISKEYGFQMDIMEDTGLEDFAYKGWQGKQGILPDARFWAIMKPKRELPKGEAVNVMSRLTEVNGFYWNTVETGARRGWSSFKVVKGKLDGAMMMGIYGEGPKGTYAFAITATEDTLKANEETYKEWIDSIKLMP